LVDIHERLSHGEQSGGRRRLQNPFDCYVVVLGMSPASFENLIRLNQIGVLQLFAELRARIIFFNLKIDVFTNTPLPSSVFIRLL
jgi:hypothetical protein